MPGQHFVNPGQLVQAVSHTKIHTKTCNLDLWPNWPWYSIGF